MILEAVLLVLVKLVFCQNIFFSMIMSFPFTTTTLNFLLQTSSEGESPALIVLKIYVLPSFTHSHTVSICPNTWTFRHRIHIYVFFKICKLMNACIERMVVLALEEYWRDFHQSLLAKKENQVFHSIFNVMKTALSVSIAWLSIQDDSWYRW